MAHDSRDPSSSPLSMASMSPEPPFGDYPTPSSDTLTELTSPSKSRDTSLALDGASSFVRGREEDDGPPPAKRRKVNAPKPRTTETLDLNCIGEQREEYDQDHEEQQVRRLTQALRKKKKIVVIAGAGISVSAGIPDFRSSNGLFKQLKSQDKMKASGKALFDAAVYRSDDSTKSFHKMVQEMSHLTQNAKPTRFHHMLASLAHEGRLLRLYTQNVDGIDTAMKPLETEVPLPSKGPWPVTIQLHGGIDKMVCTMCNEMKPFDAALFGKSEAPACPSCEELDTVRQTHGGKRSRGVGRLRPRIVLYNEGNPDDEAIGACSEADLKTRPDAVIVAGTSLKIPGLKRIVKEMCAVTRDRKNGFTAWINREPDQIPTDFRESFDLLVQGDCDMVADIAGLPEWDNNDAETVSTYTAEDAEKIKKLAALRVIVNGTNGTTTPSRKNLKKEGILTPQSPRHQSPALPKGAKAKQSKLAFTANCKATTTKATAKVVSKTAKTTTATNKIAKAAPKKKVGRPKKSSAPAIKSAFVVTKGSTITTTKESNPKNLKLEVPSTPPLLFPGLSKKKKTESGESQHDAMRPISPAAIRNNTKLEIKDSEAESSFSSIDSGSGDEPALGLDMAELPKTRAGRSSFLQSYRDSMGKTVSPKGGVPRGMEHLVD